MTATLQQHYPLVRVLAVIFVVAIVVLCAGELVNALSSILSGALAMVAIVAVFTIAVLAMSLGNRE